jgi:hypothetical protein
MEPLHSTSPSVTSLPHNHQLASQSRHRLLISLSWSKRSPRRTASRMVHKSTIDEHLAGGSMACLPIGTTRERVILGASITPLHLLPILRPSSLRVCRTYLNRITVCIQLWAISTLQATLHCLTKSIHPTSFPSRPCSVIPPLLWLAILALVHPFPLHLTATLPCLHLHPSLSGMGRANGMKLVLPPYSLAPPIGLPYPYQTHSPHTELWWLIPQEPWILHRWIYISEQLALQMQIYMQQGMYVDQGELSMTEC